MSRTVLEVLNEGIKCAGINKISDYYEKILKDFYSKCCVIDPKRNRVLKEGKYNKTYSCFDNNRQTSTLEVNIKNDNSINVNQVGDCESRGLLLVPRSKNCNAENEVINLGILTLTQISGNQPDDSLIKSEAIIDGNKGLVEKTFKDKVTHDFFSYDYDSKTLLYYTDYNKDKHEEMLELNEAVSKIYRVFKKN